jgi:subtilisin family serine protease
MKHIILAVFLFFTLFLSLAQTNTVIVKVNYTCLDYSFIDDKTEFSSSLTKCLNEKGTTLLQELQTQLPNVGNYTVEKIFPFLSTKDTLSTSRLGEKISIPPFWAAFRMIIPDNDSLTKTLSAINRFVRLFDYAHYEYIAEPQNIPNDTLYPIWQESLNDPLGLADINVEPAWAIETGEPFVTVGVHDSGVDSLHPDIVVGHGNGYYYENDTDLPEWGSDQEGHGTSVASIIGAKRNNNIGIAGIAGGNASDEMGCTLVDLKWPFILASVSPNVGASYILAGIVDGARAVGDGWAYPMNYVGLDYNNDAYYLNSPGLGLNIGNHSYILKTSIPQQLGDTTGGNKDIVDNPAENTINIDGCELCREAYLFSLRNGVINVVARGNSASISPLTDPTTVNRLYPQSFDDNWIISVGASGYAGVTVQDGVNQSTIEQITNFFSLYGAGMDIIAPGSDSIVYAGKSTELTPNNTDYKRFNGTSAAAPHVTGVVALLLSHYNKSCYTRRNLSIEDVEYMLEESATDLLSSGYDNITGHGRLNAYEAIKMIEDETKQIVHPDSLVSTTVIARDTIALGYNRAFVGDGWGPISASMPLTREAEYETERVLIENVYYYGDYILPNTQLLDYWERPSASNSTIFHEDTIKYLGSIPPNQQNDTITKYAFDYYNMTPYTYIDSIDTINHLMFMRGYYYHFMGVYVDILNPNVIGGQIDPFAGVPPGGVVMLNPNEPNADAWLPTNPFVDAEMAFSIYIEDPTLTSIYDFPCDSAYLSFVDSVVHDFTWVELNETEKDLFSVYPNPFNTEINVRFAALDLYDLQLIGTEGKVYQTLKCQEKDVSFATTNLAKGLYFLTCTNSKGVTQTYKIVKQ